MVHEWGGVYEWVLSFFKPYTGLLLLFILSGTGIILCEMSIPYFIQVFIDRVVIQQNAKAFTGQIIRSSAGIRENLLTKCFFSLSGTDRHLKGVQPGYKIGRACGLCWDKREWKINGIKVT